MTVSPRLLFGVLAACTAGASILPPSAWAQASWIPTTKTSRAGPVWWPTGERRAESWLERYRSAPRPRAVAEQRVLARLPAIPGTLVTEIEPNDTVSLATPVSLGDTLSGAINPAGDIDFFALDLTAGTVLEVDVDAAEVGSSLDPVVGLFDRDSVTILAVNDDYDGLDSRLYHQIPADGRYFVAIVDYGGSGSAGHTYTMRLGEVAVDETEPNDLPGTANAVTPPQALVAALASATDVDYFVVTADQAVILRVEFEYLTSSNFQAIATVLDADGTTVLDSVDTWNMWPWVLEVGLASAGTYYVSVRGGAEAPPAGGLYRLGFELLEPGPGDPATVLAGGLGSPRVISSTHDGRLVVLDVDGNRVFRVGLDGSVSVAATAPGYVNGMTVDGFGDILVSGYDLGSGQPRIWRIDASGAVSVFVADSTADALAMTVGPDGDVWASSCMSVCPALVRYDPVGTKKETIALADFAYDLAFSPAGVLHFTNGYDRVYRLVGSGEVVLTDAEYLEGLAFDRDGYLYVANGYLGTVALYGPDYQTVAQPFARSNLSGPIDVVFGRDTDGSTTARLFAANGGWDDPDVAGTVVEMNPDGVRAPGWTVGTRLLRVATTIMPAGVVGAPYADTLELESATGATSWSVMDGSLPPGLTLGSEGIVSGVPTDSGTFAFAVRAESGEQVGYGRVAVRIAWPTVSVTSAIDAALGVSGALTPELESFLDIQGNGNGQYDIGDLRALMRARGILTAEGHQSLQDERSGGR